MVWFIAGLLVGAVCGLLVAAFAVSRLRDEEWERTMRRERYQS